MREAEMAVQCLEAHKVSTNKTKIKLDDFRFALRHPHQRKQLARLDELHAKAAEIAAAKKLTDFDDFMDTKGLKSVGGRGGRGGRGGGRGRGRGRPRKSDE